MKKYLFILITLLTLTACTEETKEVTATPEKEEKKIEQTQEELNVEVKASSKAISFVEANGDEIALDTRVTIKGEVGTIGKQGVGSEFMLTTTEGDGYGVYNIVNYSMKDVEEGQEVTVYGLYKGKNGSGMPDINVTIIE